LVAEAIYFPGWRIFPPISFSPSSPLQDPELRMYK
jgi:hypothetical protein